MESKTPTGVRASNQTRKKTRTSHPPASASQVRQTESNVVCEINVQQQPPQTHLERVVPAQNRVLRHPRHVPLQALHALSHKVSAAATRPLGWG